jgi:predicted nucleotidyltransferase
LVTGEGLRQTLPFAVLPRRGALWSRLPSARCTAQRLRRGPLGSHAWDHGVVVTPDEGLRRLMAASGSGRLDEVCRRHGVRILTVFGSAGRGEADPADLDVGVSLEPGVVIDVLALLTDLHEVAGREVDLAVVDRASPLLRDRALMHAEPVWESVPGAWIDAAVAAHLEAMDTAWLRRLDLERLASR